MRHTAHASGFSWCGRPQALVIVGGMNEDIPCLTWFTMRRSARANLFVLLLG